MVSEQKSLDKLIYDLKERAKELTCLYEVQELFNNPESTVEEICQEMAKIMPSGWQYPDVCQAKIICGNFECISLNFEETSWGQSADIVVQDEKIGSISVYYTEERPLEDEGPFLKEERKLIDTIAEQFGFHILHHNLKEVFQRHKKLEEERGNKWRIFLDLLNRTDPKLLMQISRKMLNYLCWNGIEEAEQILEFFNPSHQGEMGLFSETNRPYQDQIEGSILDVSDDVFSIAERHLSGEAILNKIQNWIKEDRSAFLMDVLENPNSPLLEVLSAIKRYHHLTSQGLELSIPRERWLKVSLIHLLLSDQIKYVDIAHNYIEIDNFSDLLQKIIYPEGSQGRLGGKGSGLFLAGQILGKMPKREQGEMLSSVKIPKTRYLTADILYKFVSFNKLEDLAEQKYKGIEQVRQEYPDILYVFKNSPFPHEIIKSISQALDEFKETPLIVRSSSLLEDQSGASFAGKYKSLFIANQGTKEERLHALLDAIAEVYASTFGPDPIEYRVEHGLVDRKEEMGIMIQEVVGKRIGCYYIPAFAGVAYSKNEFRWSSRIKRSDGLIRIVPGLGTRAVDRLRDDYPVLIAPGQPGLRVNITLDEIVRYSPKKIDVINLEIGTFETVDIDKLLKEYGHEYPFINKLVSIIKQDHVQLPGGLRMNFEVDDFVVTFEGLISRTPFVKQVHKILSVLEETFDTAVDIEFAFDGEDFYLLQCRLLSDSESRYPADIPKDIPEEKIIFHADRYVSNGIVPGLTHIVYVDPQKYNELATRQDMLAVGRAVSMLNSILPKRQFLLMGPGRWGSRGDIRLGVSVTYSDIKNTSMLIEIAREHMDYVPELSFGTHFFQDLVEASIRYLPLYPDADGITFNEAFLLGSENILAEILPEFAYLSDVIRVIDVPTSTNGCILQVLMNAENEEALAILSAPSE
jgi:hypothetical protein